ncbi:DMT family transporter [Cupriavidus gilardii]|uniref:DMT family transporter n=1 Tax=Cupriavidus gilardii TaxID=82541 RepID=A0A849BDH2_9BURK|nr:EamA family transporter [Cupriavidus gilardii]KAB0599420.1 EamA family transporter [Cupriavidus gilardii]MCT9013084.1 DMT family transporter [Cupriavidus gilardii]MCT9052638.1 DMT family transporter [Cupriavidus gilardii]MCT9115613.1 DMT family transporter [Cupriavidus gilardii]NNH10667.1 EamA family transporter [Cupriavidus gilardii]
MTAPQARLLMLSDLMLLGVAVVWGTSYGVAKQALQYYPVLGLLALRFGLTFVLLSPALASLRSIPAASVARVAGAGVLLLGIFLCETFGLLLTRAANAAFLISLCVVLTPLIEWLLLSRRPARLEWVAVLLSLCGAWILAAGGAWPLSFHPGDALILLAALLRAIYVCAMKHSMGRQPPPALAVTALQAGVVTIGSVAVAWAAGANGAPTWPLPPLPSLPGFGAQGAFWFCLVYLVGACTLFAFFAQNYAIKRSSPTRVALLMGSEPAFGALFAWLWLGERVAPSGWIGGGLIVLASLLATVRWHRAIAPAHEVPRAVEPT